MGKLKDGKTENITIRVSEELREKVEILWKKYYSEIPFNSFLGYLVGKGVEEEAYLAKYRSIRTEMKEKSEAEALELANKSGKININNNGNMGDVSAKTGDAVANISTERTDSSKAGMLRFGTAELYITGKDSDFVDLEIAYKLYREYTTNPVPMKEFALNIGYCFVDIRLVENKRYSRLVGCRIKKASIQ